jgi:hypothetical protein
MRIKKDSKILQFWRMIRSVNAQKIVPQQTVVRLRKIDKAGRVGLFEKVSFRCCGMTG